MIGLQKQCFLCFDLANLLFLKPALNSRYIQEHSRTHSNFLNKVSYIVINYYNLKYLSNCFIHILSQLFSIHFQIFILFSQYSILLFRILLPSFFIVIHYLLYPNVILHYFSKLLILFKLLLIMFKNQLN
jgi:hypothetical protein